MSTGNSRNEGLICDPLYLAMTRPAMIFGVTYVAFLLNVICVMEIFITTRNLLYLLIIIPIHVIFFAICQRDPRSFDLALLWLQTKAAGYIFGNGRLWKSSSYSPQAITIGRRGGGQ
jgi:type IV secretion system protein VirB3